MTFDPPLSRMERRLVWLWFIAGGTAAAAMFLGVFWWWAALLFTIPVLIAAILAPTVWIYLTVGLVAWLPLRARPRRARAVTAVALLLVGLAVPAAMNLHLKAAVRAAADDRGTPVRLGAAGGTIAWLSGANDYCSYECLRFLITGKASAVLIGPPLEGLPVPERQYLRLRLMPWSDERGCPLPPDVGKRVHVPHLSLIDPDLCVAFDRAPLRGARLIFNVPGYSGNRRSSERLPALGLSVGRREVYGWQAGQPVPLYRRTEAVAPKLGVPLVLWPSQGADIGEPADWWRAGGEYRAGSKLPNDPMTMVADRLYVPEFDEQR